MHNPRHPHVLPVRDGVSPSCVVLPTRGQGSMLDFLVRWFETDAAWLAAQRPAGA